jgi:hypothetical protein
MCTKIILLNGKGITAETNIESTVTFFSADMLNLKFLFYSERKLRRRECIYNN